jgi:hypothetical protein
MSKPKHLFFVTFEDKDQTIKIDFGERFGNLCFIDAIKSLPEEHEGTIVDYFAALFLDAVENANEKGIQDRREAKRTNGR